MLWPVERAGPRDLDLVQPSVATAQRTRGAEAPVIHYERGTRLAAAQPDRVLHAEAATTIAGAGGILRQRELLEQHREQLLQHLDRLHLGDAGDRAAVRQSVDPGAAAIAAASEVVHDIGLAGFRIGTADAHVAAGPGR